MKLSTERLELSSPFLFIVLTTQINNLAMGEELASRISLAQYAPCINRH
jgi:hypothetical protein